MRPGATALQPTPWTPPPGPPGKERHTTWPGPNVEARDPEASIPCSGAQGVVPGGQAGSRQGRWAAALAKGPCRAFGDPGWGPSPGRASPGYDLLPRATVALTRGLPTAAHKALGSPLGLA